MIFLICLNSQHTKLQFKEKKKNITNTWTHIGRACEHIYTKVTKEKSKKLLPETVIMNRHDKFALVRIQKMRY